MHLTYLASTLTTLPFILCIAVTLISFWSVLCSFLSQDLYTYSSFCLVFLLFILGNNTLFSGSFSRLPRTFSYFHLKPPSQGGGVHTTDNKAWKHIKSGKQGIGTKNTKKASIRSRFWHHIRYDDFFFKVATILFLEWTQYSG